MSPERWSDAGSNRWVRAAMVLGVGTGLALWRVSAETENEAPNLPISESGMGSVAEDELAPALESNRQPLGPDPLVWPQWTSQESAAFDAGRPVNLGGGLWTAERYPLQPVPPWPTPPPARDPVAPGVLGWDVLAQFGAAREWCVDPQGLLDPGRRARLEDHLASHARTARHPVRLWVLAPGQSLVEALEDDALHRTSFGEHQPGVLAVATIDRPLEVRTILPPVLSGQAPPWRDTVVSRIDPKLAPTDQFDQLILWLSLEAEALPAVEGSVSGPSLHAVAMPAHTEKNTAFPRGLWWWLAAALTAAAGLVWIRRRRGKAAVIAAEHPAVWLENERPMRLGGSHSGGSGAVVEW